ncbi:3-deoxy-7-phosphoheptulonate synthase [Salinicoccus roseus]|jgi:3-deoxy-7-phosphoheptulonate synthase|uniref:3-deoxy-7-phosphoheptulonate synthase n=1 Tax=Salinicoccus roseus TaxID=45670 RepID=A0A265E4J3_9STAP|nr:3-deoxy-7-phosphoheptulonate synthase [Salinicoccus roseus]OZT76504.1 3-deoxy-7-phosphoheptulonate synthase [Salinicoccus roseus]RPE51035.1 3-deoxy-D-arabinoheptulosonate-7-phosphate synthase [Salinicoccus roseus]GGA78530.1 3-deoxy-7-phosphoheptulonate synthase [Salinicoccus roseus]
MIIHVAHGSKEKEIQELVKNIEAAGFGVNRSDGKNRTVIGLIGDTSRVTENDFAKYKIVDGVHRIQAPYKKANRQFHEDDSVIDIDGVKVGAENFLVCAGPCSVENEDDMVALGKKLKAAGANTFRGGAFKPRTSPYAFQGLGLEGLRILNVVKEETGLPIVSELMSTDYIDEFVESVDVIQVGARNMQNFDLLKAIGETDKPVLLKRGMSATMKEWLMSAEYVMAGGNDNVIFCERGIRTFETATRNTLDLQAVPVIQKESHLPIVIDPSHAAGVRHIIPSMAKAAVMSGANGLQIEVHEDPENAWSDGQQCLTPDEFAELMQTIDMLLEIEKKTATGKQIVQQ